MIAAEQNEFDKARSLQGLFDTLAEAKPGVGKTVRVNADASPKKHAGKVGEVFWHGADQFQRVYANKWDWIGESARVARGVYGYRVGIRTAEGEKFFVKASDVTIINNTAH